MKDSTFLSSMVSLSELLPQNETTIIRDFKQYISIINFSKHIYKDIIDAVCEFYINKNFYKFDPHVGESACQIRANLIYYIYRHTKNYIGVTLFIESIKNKINFLNKLEKDPKYFYTNFKQGASIESLIKFIELDYKVNLNIILLYLCYVLTNQKKNNYKEEMCIDIDKFMNDYQITRKMCKKFIHYLQKKLSWYSCEFIFHLSKSIQTSKNFDTLLHYTLTEDDDGRYVLPCYLSMKVMLNYMLKNIYTLVLDIDYKGISHRKRLKLRANSEGKCLFLDKNSDTINPCLIVEGMAITSYNSTNEYIIQIREHSIYTIILAYMACHPQYNGKKLHFLSEDLFKLIKENKENQYSLTDDIKNEIHVIENELYQMRLLAEKIGCTKDNKNMFFIRHVYCSNFGNILPDIFDRVKQDTLL